MKVLRIDSYPEVQLNTTPYLQFSRSRQSACCAARRHVTNYLNSTFKYRCYCGECTKLNLPENNIIAVLQDGARDPGVFDDVDYLDYH